MNDDKVSQASLTPDYRNSYSRWERSLDACAIFLKGKTK